MEVLLETLQWIQRVAFLGLALICVRLWRRYRSSAAAWAAATFGSLALIVIVAAVAGPDAEGLPQWLLKLLLGILVLFPYFLYRFTAALVRPPRWAERAALAATAALVVWSLALPDLPPAHQPQPSWLRAYVFGLVIQWTALSLPVSVVLWVAGRGQPTLPRRRMRLLGGAALGLNISIIVSGSVGGVRPLWVDVLVAVIGLAGAVLFYLAFAPPATLRSAWRRREEESLRQAAVGVSSATSLEEVTSALLPHIAAIFGGRGALLARRDGEILGLHEMDRSEANSIIAELSAESEAHFEPGLMVLPLRKGMLVAKTSPFTPFFGREEADLLLGIGAFIDLALERAELFEAERESRTELEEANSELESFLYSVSHDLQSPLVSISGYVGYLNDDFGERLGPEGSQYLERISANTTYMENLIRDLLELSRVGRLQTEPSEVDLRSLVQDIATEIETAHPAVSIEVGRLPIASMNPARARQLFTNLLENAVQHGGAPDIAIRVTARETSSGPVEVSVADDGRGIPPSYREKVFRTFERLEPSGSGTGIGLSICRKIVDQLSGRIWIGEAKEGTDVRIEFPARVVLAWDVEVRT